MEILKVRDIVKLYDGRPALDGVSFDVERGEFLSVLGPSGCGKTTLLNVLSTIDIPTSGSIRMVYRYAYKVSQSASNAQTGKN